MREGNSSLDTFCPIIGGYRLLAAPLTFENWGKWSERSGGLTMSLCFWGVFMVFERQFG